MKITIEVSSPKPVYEQLVRQIESAITSGRLKSGTALPPIRQLAGDLSLNPNTVARAYQILERKRVIRTAGRKGTFVHSDAETQIGKNRYEWARNKLSDVVADLLEGGMSEDGIRTVFADVMNHIPEA